MNLCKCCKDNIYLLASFFVIKSKNLNHLHITQLHLSYIARKTDFYLSVSLPSNSYLAAYIEALFRIKEFYVLNFLFFWGTETLSPVSHRN